MDDLISKLNAMLAKSGHKGLVLSGADIVESAARSVDTVANAARAYLRDNERVSVEPPSPPLGVEQRYVFERMECGGAGDVMFITGKAGTGKSFLLKYFRDNTKKRIAVVAPTGMAAVNVGGQTIHSFFRLDLSVQRPDSIDEIGDPSLRGKLRCFNTLVIDEVSMVRADVMDMIDRKLKLANDNDLPFGGKQVIMFGDPYQLPPVVDDSIDRELPRFFDDNYGSAFFFSAPVIRDCPLTVYELTEMFRQRDDREFVDFLNKVRDGTVECVDIDKLNARCVGKSADGGHYTTLVPTNEAASRINNEKLRRIPAREFTYEAIIEDKGGKIKALDFPAERYLKLKVGALVVMLENGEAWVNGTLGVVSFLDEDFVRVKIRDVEHTINKRVWEKKEYRYDAKSKSLTQKTVAAFTQYPVKLAWALTIHKAQGQTYDAVAIDMGRGAFECGQAYVALSRCRGMDTLRLIRPLQLTDIKVNQNVAEFMRSVGKNGAMNGGTSRLIGAANAVKSIGYRGDSDDPKDGAQNGVNEDISINNVNIGINDEERELLSLFRRLGSSDKRLLGEFLRKRAE